MTQLNVMFDIDGTLIQSVDFDESLFIEAVALETGLNIDTRWETYPHVTDIGLIYRFCQHHDLQNQFEDIHKRIKRRFINGVANYLAANPAPATDGALSFIEKLAAHPNYLISYATGGWRASALLKLNSAGFKIDESYLFSSDNDYKRTAIMEAARRCQKVIYFGDGAWDKKACKELGIPLIAVGNSLKHKPMIRDFSDHHTIFNLFECLAGKH